MASSHATPDTTRAAHVRSAWHVVLAAAAVALCVVPATAQAPADPAPTHGLLDGRQFVGTFGPRDGGVGRIDTLFFSEGRFWSANCVPCGFVPALYWVRQDGNAIHFRGEMFSRDRGQFTYTGTLRGDRIEADVRWQKARWYWSIDRSFRFEGRLVEGPVEVSLAGVTRRAEQAGIEPEPDAYCPL